MQYAGDSPGDGLKNRTAWAGAGDGMLFYDAGNDGQITQDREFAVTEWDPTANDDRTALRGRTFAWGEGDYGVARGGSLGAKDLAGARGDDCVW